MVIFSTNARRDLQQIGDWIEKSSGRRTARTWVERLQRRTDDLILHPYAGQADGDLGGHRRLVELAYLIFYEAGETGDIVILRVVDGRRDLTTIFPDSTDVL